MKKYKIRIIIGLIILIFSILGIVFACIGFYNLWLNEYNEQMQRLGFYKNDIILLNQMGLEILNITILIISIISFIISIGIAIIEWLDK